MISRHTAVVVLAAASLTGCASKPAEVDNTPLIRTAVIKTTVENSGIKGFFGNKTDRTVSVMNQISRIDEKIAPTGSVLSRIGRKQDRSDIIRLDRDLEWAIDNRKKTYSECPIGGCAPVLFNLQALHQQDASEAEEYEDELDSCVVSITENSISYEPTGQSRTVNGFPAVEHEFNWTIRGKDDAGETFHNEISVINWMTPVTGVVGEAVAMHAAFDRNYRSRLAQRIPENAYGVLPPEVAEIIVTQLTAGMEEAEIDALLRKFAQLSIPEGYSISNKVSWDAHNNTCTEPPEPEEEKNDSLDTSSFSGLLRSVGKRVVDQEVDRRKAEKAREISLRPILSVLTDVQSIDILDIRESKLTVQDSFRLVDRS